MPLCKKCFKEFPINGLLLHMNPRISLCYSCFKEFEPKMFHFKTNGANCLAIYSYDSTIKDNLYTLKGCFDKELAPIFLDRFEYELKLRYFNYIVVPIPSSFEDDLERGFNHVEEIFYFLKPKMKKVIYKKYKMKQSQLSLKERMNIGSVFDIKNASFIKNKKVLIIDDVYTSGSSFKAAYALINKYKPKKVEGLFLSKNIKEEAIKDKKLRIFSKIRAKIKKR